MSDIGLTVEKIKLARFKIPGEWPSGEALGDLARKLAGTAVLDGLSDLFTPTAAAQSAMERLGIETGYTEMGAMTEPPDDALIGAATLDDMMRVYADMKARFPGPFVRGVWFVDCRGAYEAFCNAMPAGFVTTRMPLGSLGDIPVYEWCMVAYIKDFEEWLDGDQNEDDRPLIPYRFCFVPGVYVEMSDGKHKRLQD
ncbi:MAG: hypothetical protein GY803_10455, partial [Chloroflexi bacterium]|nr:hypothetical protein [Chloroflexota bacterium]